MIFILCFYVFGIDPVEIFCLIAGPPSEVKQNQVFSEARGESVDIVPTIAHLLGFKTEVPTGMMQGRVLTEALV